MWGSLLNSNMQVVCCLLIDQGTLTDHDLHLFFFLWLMEFLFLFIHLFIYFLLVVNFVIH